MSEVKNEDVNSSLPVAYEDDGTDYWQSHLDSWVQSGLSQAAYCRRHDLDYGRFRKWKERLSTFPKHSSIKLVEVKRDFSFSTGPQFQSPFFDSWGTWGTWCSGTDSPNGKIPSSEINRVGDRQSSSGIRFWCGPYCIEIAVGFSSEGLTQLIRTLQNVQGLQSPPVTKGNEDKVKDKR